MQWGFVENFIHVTAEYSVLDFMASMQELGFYIHRPSDGAIINWYTDSKGTREIKLDIDDVIKAIRENGRAEFVFWLNEVDYIWATVMNVNPDILIEMLFVDTLTEKQAQAAIDACERRFERLAKNGHAIGFVADIKGNTEDYDWRAFFVEKSHDIRDLEKVSSLLPERIGICGSKDGDFGNFFMNWSKRKFGSCYLYSRDSV